MPAHPDLPATLLLSVEIPALGLHELLSFALKPTSEQHGDIVEHVTQSMLDIAGDLQEHLVTVDMESAREKLERAQAKARQDLDAWGERLKAAQDGLVRVDVAKKQLNDMRSCYYKELTHLREQLHLKAVAEESGKTFEPSNFFCFNPTRYSFDDETGALLKECADELQRKFNNERAGIRTQVDDLTLQLQTSKLLVTRKEQLLQGLLAKHGYKGEIALEQALCGPPVAEDAGADDMTKEPSLPMSAVTSAGNMSDMMPKSSNKARAAVGRLLLGSTTISSALRSVSRTLKGRGGATPSFDSEGSNFASPGRLFRGMKSRSNVSALACRAEPEVADAAVQSDLQGSIVEDAVNMLLGDRAEAAWRQLQGRVGGAAEGGAFEGAEGADGRALRGGVAPKVDAWAQTEQAAARGREVGVQCCPLDVPQGFGPEAAAHVLVVTAPSSPAGEDNSPPCSKRAATLSKDRTLSRSMDSNLSTSSALLGILQKHGVSSTPVSTEDTLPPPEAMMRESASSSSSPRPGMSSTASLTRRRSLIKGSAATHGSAAAAPSATDDLGNFVAVTPAAGPGRAQRRASGVTPEVSRTLSEKLRRGPTPRHSSVGLEGVTRRYSN